MKFVTVVTVDDQEPPSVGWSTFDTEELKDDGVLFLVPCASFYVKAFDTEEEADAWGEDMAFEWSNFTVTNLEG